MRGGTHAHIHHSHLLPGLSPEGLAEFQGSSLTRKPHHSQESQLAPERSRMPPQAAGHSREQAVTVDMM